ncbi:MAG: hypothetical protein Q8P07_03855 [bacterium]|nr:hypothetical protein [bacterium]
MSVKKTIVGVIVMALALFSTNAFAGRTGLNGIFLFLELQANAGNSVKNFYDIVDFDEALRQSSLPRAGGRRICENKIGGFDYIFWFETGSAPKKEKNFLLTIKQKQSKNKLETGGGIFNISTEKVHGKDETNLLVLNIGVPKFHVNVYGTYAPKFIFGPPNNRRIDQYSKLDCRYSYRK